jgi:phytoene desaturase
MQSKSKAGAGTKGLRAILEKSQSIFGSFEQLAHVPFGGWTDMAHCARHDPTQLSDCLWACCRHTPEKETSTSLEFPPVAGGRQSLLHTSIYTLIAFLERK